MQSSNEHLIHEYQRVRGWTEKLSEPLSAEDQCLQSMPDCSPTKWHRAHTTWFFETFILQPRGIPPHNSDYSYLFNSYYEAVGPRHPRPQRGLLSRPSCAEVAAYRRAVDGRMVELLGQCQGAELESLAGLLDLGLAHEQQHQELLLTDALHALAQNPLRPAYRLASQVASAAEPSTYAHLPLEFVELAGGLGSLGIEDGAGFHFDNEGPRHRVFLEPFAIARRLVSVGEWKDFASAGGYDEPSFWLAEGFAWVQAQGVRAPCHALWDGSRQSLSVFGMDGLREARDDEPIAHLSYYEADALARFMGARLPTEAEWEMAALASGADPNRGNFLDQGVLRPQPHRVDAPTGDRIGQLFGDAWEWTQSSYAPYPGYQPSPGAVGEYNGKFMVNQQVLRGGSCFTPAGHVRPTYRNFWPAATGFQMTGVRLARSLT